MTKRIHITHRKSAETQPTPTQQAQVALKTKEGEQQAKPRKASEEWAEGGEWAQVQSSNVQAIRYDKDRQALAVQFKGGWVYTYLGVGLWLAEEMFNAASKGKFVHQRLRGAYSFEKRKG